MIGGRAERLLRFDDVEFAHQARRSTSPFDSSAGFTTATSIVTQLAPEKIEFPAQQRELAEHGAEGGSIVAPEVGDGLEVWLQGSQQLDYLDVASSNETPKIYT